MKCACCWWLDVFIDRILSAAFFTRSPFFLLPAHVAADKGVEAAPALYRNVGTQRG